MFQVDDYKVKFRHVKKSEFSFVKAYTECVITRNNGFSVQEYALCHPNDQYDKNTGRKLALTRALKCLTKDRELRKRFWNAYFAARNGKH